jgi:hypothetical protein
MRVAFAALLLLCACDRGDRPLAQTAPAGPLPPMPPPPAWSAELAQKPLKAAFPAVGGSCKGVVDGVVAHLQGGTTIAGWGWDPAGERSIGRIVLVDAGGRMVAFGEGGLERRDVSRALPEVSAPDTGWTAHLPRTGRRLTAYGVLADGRACRLGVTPEL